MNESIHGERTASELQDRVTELVEQQAAISEVLRAIASSPHDLQPIFDAILDSATRLCRADIGTLRLAEESGLRRVAVRGDPLLVSRAKSSIPLLAEKGSLPTRWATGRLLKHVPDLTVLEGDQRDDFLITVVNAGFRTGLVLPLLKDNEIVGTISVGRKQVQPFTDKPICLFTDFAAQATIALESIRRERQYREAQSELAHMVATRLACASAIWASRYCRSRRVLSKAMLACAAKSLNKQICLSVNGCTCLRPRLIIPTISLSLSNGTPRPVRRPAFTTVIQKSSRRSPSTAVKSGMWAGNLLAANRPIRLPFSSSGINDHT